MVEGGWGACAWRTPPPFVLGGVEGQWVGVRAARGPSDLTITGAPRRYPVTEPWCRRVLAPYAVTPERAAALEREYPDIERQPALIPLPRRWPARETGIYARAARRAVIDTLLAKGASEGEAAAYIGHSVRAQRSHYRTHPTPGECAMAERLRAAAR